MTAKLFTQAIIKFTAGVMTLSALLFIPAGTPNYPGARRLMCVLFIPMFIAGVVMMLRSPGLLEKRLKMKEEQPEQARVVKLSGLMFVSGFITAGLSFRFDRFTLPEWASWAACGLFLLGYLLYAEVLRENAYLSRTIEVREGQKVVDTGLYGVVRHPMYGATLILFLSMPVILGSWAALVIFLAYPLIIAKRIKNEEEVLERELEGYAEYKSRVKYKLLPFIW